jgi:hypothetical protein
MKLIIQRRRTYIVPLLVVLVFCASAALGWRYIANQQAQHAQQLSEMSTERGQLLEDYRLLLIEKREAEVKVDMLNQTSDVDTQAYAKVSEHLKSLQKEIVDLNEEVTFYRGIVADSGAGTVHIKHFAVQTNDSTGGYQYSLVLTRGTRSDKVAKGKVQLAIEGTLKGQQKRIDLKDFGGEDASALVYQFKYFQRFTGQLALPKDFNPQRITIKVTAAGSSNRPLRKSFDWAAINS